MARIRLARRLQSLGLTLDEIIGALHAQDAGQASGSWELCASERWRLREALDRIESRLADLARVRAEVRDALDACEAGACRAWLAGRLAHEDQGTARRAVAVPAVSAERWRYWPRVRRHRRPLIRPARRPSTAPSTVPSAAVTPFPSAVPARSLKVPGVQQSRWPRRGRSRVSGR